MGGNELPDSPARFGRGFRAAPFLTTIIGMSTELSIADVERVAALAQIELTDTEKQLFTRQLADILHYAEQIQTLDTAGIPATAHVNPDQRERDDRPEPSLPVEAAVAGAPDAAPDAGLFRVPRVIGG